MRGSLLALNKTHEVNLRLDMSSKISDKMLKGKISINGTTGHDSRQIKLVTGAEKSP